MKSLWNDQDAQQYQSDLGLRVYTSRLLGQETALVLHGGGNTSVKIRESNILGQQEEILYVKGSGWDLATIETEGFSPVRIDHLLELARLPSLSDLHMVNELRTHMTLASAPTPSVEAILHAIIPYRYVDHTHADAIVTITNTADGEKRIREIFGDRVVIIPYIMPGFDLARLCAERYAAEAHSGTIGMVLLNHGIFSFADSARESYENMISLVDEAESYLQENRAWDIPAGVEMNTMKGGNRLEIAGLRAEASRCLGKAMILSCHNDAHSMSFVRHSDIARISQQGPATPDHVIRTKRLPLLGRNITKYAEEYRRYFETHAAASEEEMTILDQVPRIILDQDLGMCTLGRSIKDADIVADIYDHTIDIIQRAEKLGGYQALPAKDIFEVEYWELEQAKLKRAGKAPLFTGEVALVTGAASGIGKACVDSLLQRGAAVIALDIDSNVESLSSNPAFLGITCDITDRSGLNESLDKGINRFGGLDILILNAGIFPGGKRIESLGDEEWRRVMDLNLDINLTLLRECHPLLKLAPNGGRVLIVGSKNVPAPGPGAAAYSTSKAALNQLARVAALEWGQDGIRVNTLHPDAVFDTGLWSEEVLEARARHYGLTVEQYKTKNILKTEIHSHDVSELACEMCGPLFAKTTGAQLPIDGGNDRVI
jgi:rhamnose utilization protein RhaD (predicted bifunctional aldolase and dehydrogenase)/NAD(P)-dependent dehydrogenase (short-subunit alcohol dehydrogenase family)